MQRIKVGMPFRHGVSSYAAGVHYNYSSAGHTLILSRIDPGLSEIFDVRKGCATFAIGVTEEVLFLFGKFGDQAWQMAHYNWWINPPIMRPDPVNDLHSLNGGFSVSICLINAANGIVEALRSVHFSHDFASLILGSVELQIHYRFDPEHYAAVVERAGRNYLDERRILGESIGVCVIDGSLAGHPVCSDSFHEPEIRWH